MTTGPAVDAGHALHERPGERSGDAIAAAAGGEQLDHLVVGERDHEHRERGGEGEVERELAVRSERESDPVLI